MYACAVPSYELERHMAGTVVSGEVDVWGTEFFVLVFDIAIGMRLPLEVLDMCSDEAMA